jgi:hypothetical protein
MRTKLLSMQVGVEAAYSKAADLRIYPNSPLLLILAINNNNNSNKIIFRKSAIIPRGLPKMRSNPVSI